MEGGRVRGGREGTLRQADRQTERENKIDIERKRNKKRKEEGKEREE